MEIANRNVIFPGSVGLAQAHPLTKPLAMGDGLPPDLVQLRSTLPIGALVLGTQLSKMSFDKIFDLADGVYFYFYEEIYSLNIF